MPLSTLRRLLANGPAQVAAPTSRPNAPASAITHRATEDNSQSPDRLEVNTWETSQWALHLASIVGVHPYPLSELMLMAAVFFYEKPHRVIDIGTHEGKSARVWYELGQSMPHPVAVHTIDLCDPEHAEFPGQRLGQHIQGLDVQQHIGDGLAVAQELMAQSPDTPTLIFFDGDHAFETVQRELALLASLKGQGALFHDTFVQPNSTYNHGPYEAIQDHLAKHPDSVAQVVHTHLGLPGMTYLRMR